jgi:diguanylate cyclase (GGDEF)-like protein/PAS domain S-box-containing protein
MTLGRRYRALATVFIIVTLPFYAVVTVQTFSGLLRAQQARTAASDLRSAAGLIHAIQTERSLTDLWVVSHGDEQAAQRLAAQRRVVDALHHGILESLKSRFNFEAAALLSGAHREHDRHLARLRREADDRAASPEALFEGYTAVIQNIVGQISVIGRANSLLDAPVNGMAQTHYDIENIKEIAAVEQAHVAAWLSHSKTLDIGHLRHWKTMVVRQRGLLAQAFASDTVPAILVSDDGPAAHEASQAVETLRMRIAAGMPVDARDWLTRTTRYLEWLDELSRTSLQTLATRTAEQERQLRIMAVALAALLVAAAAVSAAHILFTLRRVIRPLGELHAVAEELEREPGHVRRSSLGTHDEIGRLGAAFNRMVDAAQAARHALAASERRYSTLVEQSLVGVYQIEDGRFTYVNPRFAEMFGRDIADLVGTPPLALVAPEDRERIAAQMARDARELCAESHYVFSGICDKGQRISVEAYGTTVEQDGRVLMIGMCQDVTERSRAEQDQRLAATLFEANRHGVVITDRERRILRVNHAFENITGYTAAEAVGHRPQELLNSGRQDADFYAAMWRSIGARGHWEGEIWNRRRNGEMYPEWLSIDAVRDSDGGINCYVGVFSDLTRQKELDARVRELSLYDPLTNLPNRRLINERLEETLARARREGGAFAVLFLDVDHFKNVNDSLGHLAGDMLLRQTAERLHGALRSGKDGRDPDIVGRIGGDEFVAIVGGLTGRHDVLAAAASILQRFSEPLQLNGQPFRLTVSIGISVYPDDADSVQSLLGHADLAVYEAKRAGRNNFRFYTPELEAQVRSHVWIENNVPQALAREELAVHYQPLLAIASGQTIGAEALLRWRHPERGDIPPAEFIPVLEDSGLIEGIGVWVLERACRDLAGWRARGLVDERFRMSVNLSGRQLRDPTLPERVAVALASHNLAPANLELELTESVAMEHMDASDDMLARLRAAGVQLAIDDFGTGHSSLARLHRFGFHRLKIDRSFTAGMAHDTAARSIVRATIALARGLGLEALAEGVETEQQLELLRQYGCDSFQGHLAGAPCPASAVEHLLARASRPATEKQSVPQSGGLS